MANETTPGNAGWGYQLIGALALVAGFGVLGGAGFVTQEMVGLNLILIGIVALGFHSVLDHVVRLQKIVYELDLFEEGE